MKISVFTQFFAALMVGLFPYSLHAEPMPQLGVSTKPLPKVLVQQLKLKHGLVIGHVRENSPAAEAGLKESDILLKIDDQMIFNGSQLSALVAWHGVDKAVTLEVMSGGEIKTLKAVIGRAEKGAHLEAPVGGTYDFALEIRRQLEESGLSQWDTGGLGMTAVMSIQVLAPDGAKLSVRDDNGAQKLMILGKDGKMIYDGPLKPGKDDKPIPEEYQKMIGLFEITPGGFGFEE